MADPLSNPEAPKPAFSSLTLKGALAMIIAYGVARLGLQLPEGFPTEAASALVDIAFAIGALAVGVGRARARTPLI